MEECWAFNNQSQIGMNSNHAADILRAGTVRSTYWQAS